MNTVNWEGGWVAVKFQDHWIACILWFSMEIVVVLEMLLVMPFVKTLWVAVD
jgi:hypothetical protein